MYIYIYMHTYVHIYIYIYTHMCGSGNVVLELFAYIPSVETPEASFNHRGFHISLLIQGLVNGATD